jgi:hypothetical protein
MKKVMMRMKRFIETSPVHQVGLKIVLAEEKGLKKIPSLRIEDWGFYPLAPFTVLSSKTFHEEYPGRFSDSRILLLLAPSHPSTTSGQWLFASFVPDYSGGSVPDSLIEMKLQGSLHLDIAN